MQPQINEAMKHFGKGFAILAEAFQAAGIQTQEPTQIAAATTAKAKKAADKKAEVKAEEPAAEAEEQKPEPVAAPVAEKKAAKKKADEPEFLTLDRDGKIEHLRTRMVQVSVKLQGDREKVYSFLKKYKVTKVAELSDENLDALKNDIEVFLGGPDALGV